MARRVQVAAVCLCVLIALPMWGGSVRLKAQAAQAPSAAVERGGLEVAVRSLKDTFTVGEPLALEVVYRNVSTEAFRLRHEVTPTSTGDGWTLLVEDVTSGRKYTGVSMLPMGAAPNPNSIHLTTLRPGASLATAVTFQSFGFVEGALTNHDAALAIFRLRGVPPRPDAIRPLPPGTYRVSVEIRSFRFTDSPTPSDAVRQNQERFDAALAGSDPIPLWKDREIVSTPASVVIRGADVRQDDPAAVRALLKSADPREQAWGAWMAGRDLLYEVIPELQSVVTALLPLDAGIVQEGSPIRPSSVTLDVALDALIQLRAQTPPSLAGAVLKSRPAPALILLSFDGPSADAVLRELAMTDRGHTWFVAENLLLYHRASGQAVTILSGLTLTGILEVKRDGAVPGGYGFSHSSGGSPDILLPGYPPIAHYMTLQGCVSGCVMLADGPTPIYYERDVGPAGVVRTTLESRLEGGPDSGSRLHYLEKLLTMVPTFDQPMDLKEYEMRSTVWRDQATLDAEVTRFRDDILGRYLHTVDQFVSAGLLTRAEAATVAKPLIDVEIRYVPTFRSAAAMPAVVRPEAVGQGAQRAVSEARSAKPERFAYLESRAMGNRD